MEATSSDWATVFTPVVTKLDTPKRVVEPAFSVPFAKSPTPNGKSFTTDKRGLVFNAFVSDSAFWAADMPNKSLEDTDGFVE